MRVDLNHCMICDNEIVPGKRTQVEVNWSNGSIMPIGICVDCATNHRFTTAEGKKAVEDWHHAYWDKNHGRYDPEVHVV